MMLKDYFQVGIYRKNIEFRNESLLKIPNIVTSIIIVQLVFIKYFNAKGIYGFQHIQKAAIGLINLIVN